MRAKRSPGSLAFWSAAAILLVVGLGAGGFHGSEDRFAEITREMLVTGDFHHPRINGESHFYKPLLSYWAIAAASLVTGRLDELSARLPSALAGLLALGATVSIGRRSAGHAAGRLAGWLLLSSYGFLLWGRTATAEMENLAAVGVAVAWFVAREGKPSFGFYVVFYLICAVGAHAKGLATVALPLLAAVAWLAPERRWRAHLRGAHLVAILVAAVLYLTPFALADLTRHSASPLASLASGDPESGLYMVFHENVRRFFAPFDHRGPPHTYLVALPELLLPWTPVFLVALASVITGFRRAAHRARWLGLVVGLIFALFTASGSRRSYYILPILPFCALLVAVHFEDMRWPALQKATLRLIAAVLVAGAVAETAAPALAVVVGLGFALPTPLALVALTFLIGALGLSPWLLTDERRAALARALGVSRDIAPHLLSAVILLGGFFCFQGPMLDRFRTEKPFALALRQEIGNLKPDRIAFVQHVPALFPFYLDLSAPVPVLGTREELEAFIRSGGGLVVASRKGLARLGGGLPAELEAPPLLEEQIQSWEAPSSNRWMAWRVGFRDMEGG